MYKKYPQNAVRWKLPSVMICIAIAVSILPVVALAGDNDEVSWVGDASPGDCEFQVFGNVEQIGYFTVEGLKKIAADLAETREYSWTNSSGATGTDTFTGVCIEDFFSSIMKLNDHAGGMIVQAADGYRRVFSLDDVTSGAFWRDGDGNRMMLAWRGTASMDDRSIIDYDMPRIVVGRNGPDDANRSSWATDVFNIWVTVFSDYSDFGRSVVFIEGLYNMGVVTGVNGSRFAPEVGLSRAMFVTMLGRALNSEPELLDDADGMFSDVDYASWYGKYVEWAVNEGFVQGYSDGTFRPSGDLTVNHMLLMAERAGLVDVPEGIDSNANRPATREEAAIVLYALVAKAPYSWTETVEDWLFEEPYSWTETEEDWLFEEG